MKKTVFLLLAFLMGIQMYAGSWEGIKSDKFTIYYRIENEYAAKNLMKQLTEYGTVAEQNTGGNLKMSYFVIDDFGTGHSSLAYLKQLPITKLKIDQSFVQNLEESGEDRAIARTIIELGRGLGLKVLAEGVETQGQKEFIYSSGCELMQGYLFSKPIRAEDAELLLKNQMHML